jgi:geranylgeranyl diphosphate synthase type II
MNKEFLTFKTKVDCAIETAISQAPFKESALYEPMKYVLTASGKRVRGVLTLAFCERLGVEEAQAIPFAVALEFIHAYSLVHDDLPEMDNDEYRRGIPTCHKKYGHALALLTGDAILNYTAEYLLSKRKLYQPDRFLNAFEILFNGSGVDGMLGGQAIDKMGENRTLSLDELLLLHQKKTGALLLAPILIAQQLANKNEEDYVNYSKSIGLAFQIKDDILDVEGSAELMGKTLGKDAEENKSTFISILGLDRSKKFLEKEIATAIQSAGGDTLLLWIAEYIANREN